MFAAKLCKAFASCWSSSKGCKSGERLHPSKFQVIQAFGEDREASPPASTPMKKCKVEPSACLVKGEGAHIWETKVKQEPDSQLSPLVSSSLDIWGSAHACAPNASGATSFSPKVAWGSVKQETLPTAPFAATFDQQATVCNCRHGFTCMCAHRMYLLESPNIFQRPRCF